MDILGDGGYLRGAGAADGARSGVPGGLIPQGPPLPSKLFEKVFPLYRCTQGKGQGRYQWGGGGCRKDRRMG